MQHNEQITTFLTTTRSYLPLKSFASCSPNKVICQITLQRACVQYSHHIWQERGLCAFLVALTCPVRCPEDEIRRALLVVYKSLFSLDWICHLMRTSVWPLWLAVSLHRNGTKVCCGDHQGKKFEVKTSPHSLSAALSSDLPGTTDVSRLLESWREGIVGCKPLSLSKHSPAQMNYGKQEMKLTHQMILLWFQVCFYICMFLSFLHFLCLSLSAIAEMLLLLMENISHEKPL